MTGSILDLKNMTDHLIHDYIALKVEHDLIDFDNFSRAGELDRLGVRVGD